MSVCEEKKNQMVGVMMPLELKTWLQAKARAEYRSVHKTILLILEQARREAEEYQARMRTPEIQAHLDAIRYQSSAQKEAQRRQIIAALYDGAANDRVIEEYALLQQRDADAKTGGVAAVPSAAIDSQEGHHTS